MMPHAMPWILAEPSDGITLVAAERAVILRAENLDVTHTARLRDCVPRTRLGHLLPALIPQLIEMGLASTGGETVELPYANFAALSAHEIDAFDDVAPSAPFSLELRSSGWLGSDTLHYYYRFYLGPEAVPLSRRGCFVRRREVIYRLDPQSYALIEAIDSFNALPAAMKTAPEAWLRFAEIRGLADGVGAQLDRFLHEERVIVPPRIGVDIQTDEHGRITFVPTVDGPADAGFAAAFLGQDDIDEVYTVGGAEGARVRIVLNQDQREALRRMQRVRRIGGSERAKILRNPQAVFDGVAGAVDIEPEAFGPRVRGIGDFPFATQPYIQRGSGIFDDPPPGDPGSQPCVAGLHCSYADGHEEDVTFASSDDLSAVHQAVHEAYRSGAGTVDINGKSVVVDHDFVQAIDELTEHLLPERRRNQEAGTKRQRRFLLIYTNEGALEYEEDVPEATLAAAPELPRALLRPDVLKPHQLAGLAWLQRCFRMNRRGCLLADDMGLGKTLQVLTFLAWAIEQGELAKDSADPEQQPWDPILIVAPLVLIESETWLNDARSFFAGDGAIFQPWVVLRGGELQSFRRPDVAGQETRLGESVLDLDKLRSRRVVLTNYETITNYQHSFARMKDRWSIIVTDEAQEYKIPNTKISHALKSLSPRFRVACTGTPVETRLLDVWNLFDFLQPGHLLGSASDFARVYECGGEDAAPNIAGLKARLKYGSADSFVLRRDKRQLPDLPPKTEHPLRADLSPEQRATHLELLAAVRQGTHPLSVIQQLMHLYQHPALVPTYQPLPTSAALERCPKLQAVVDCLRQIQARREKVLIFTRTLNMQLLLSQIIFDVLQSETGIVNGSSSRGGGKTSRKATLREFRERPGFAALILSPDVAGLGLTLTEANHVIHYGRWWNPAKEAQATDRAYRIGQTREVRVYYPISVDPLRQFETFDEKLDALLRRRHGLAAEFLAPLPTDEELQNELIGEVIEMDTPVPSPTARARDSMIPLDQMDLLFAHAEQSAGREVHLAPKYGNEGVHVLSVAADGVRLAHCVMSPPGTTIEAADITTALRLIDAYRARHLRRFGRAVNFHSVVICSEAPSRSAREAARNRADLVEVATILSSLREQITSAARLALIEDRRLASPADVVSALQRSLLRMAGSADTAPAPNLRHEADEWIDALMATSRYAEQRSARARASITEDRIREVLRALAERGDRLTRLALAQRIGLSLPRVTGLLAVLADLLNVDGYPVLAIDEESSTVTLNRSLLERQFGLADGPG